MKAILIDHPGDESVLSIGDVESPKFAGGSIRIRVHATAVEQAERDPATVAILANR